MPKRKHTRSRNSTPVASRKPRTRPRTTIFQIPVEDVLVENLAKYMTWVDIYNFSLCSRQCKYIADCMIAKGLEEVIIYGDSKYNLNPYCSVIQNSTRLRKVVFQHMDRIDNAICEKFLQNNRRLEEVSIFSCKAITSLALFPLVNCAKLRRLHLSYMQIDEYFFNYLCEHNNSLVEINMTNLKISARGIIEFFSKQPLLERITLSLDYLNGNVVECLNALPKLCPKLKYLDIHNVSIADYNDSLILILAEQCPNLVKIVISSDTFEYEVNDEIYAQIAEKGIEVERRERDGPDAREDAYYSDSSNLSNSDDSNDDYDNYYDFDGSNSDDEGLCVVA